MRGVVGFLVSFAEFILHKHKMLEWATKIAYLHRSFKLFLQVNTDVLLDALEAVFIKIHSPVLCQQKEFGKVLYFIVQENARSSVLFSHLLFVLGVGFWPRMVIE